MSVLDVVLANPVKRDCFFHAALIKRDMLGWKSAKAELQARELLKQHGSFERAYSGGSLFPDLSFGGASDIAERIASVDFKTIYCTNPDVPFLKHSRAPAVLYVSGDVSLLNRRIMAVVGSRDIVDADLVESEARLAVGRLIDDDYVILSGLAKGCDSLAHRLAVEFGGRTVAVLGTSLADFYPRENSELQRSLMSNHCVVSQFPVGLSTQDRYGSAFVHRDITQEVLSEGVVVLQASDKSGTRYAINSALKAKKTVFALPNNYGRGFEWVSKRGVVRYEVGN